MTPNPLQNGMIAKLNIRLFSKFQKIEISLYFPYKLSPLDFYQNFQKSEILYFIQSKIIG